jgi:hypothetical protein
MRWLISECYAYNPIATSRHLRRPVSKPAKADVCDLDVAQHSYANLGPAQLRQHDDYNT